MHLHEADYCIGWAAVCRHQVPQCAVNLYKTGERYAYSHYLLTAHILPNRAPAFLSQDIACKHKVWRHKVEEALQRPASQNCAAAVRTRECADKAQALVDVLPEAHGSVHAFPCQVASVVLSRGCMCYTAGIKGNRQIAKKKIHRLQRDWIACKISSSMVLSGLFADMVLMARSCADSLWIASQAGRSSWRK